MSGSRLWNEAEDVVFDRPGLASQLAAAATAGFRVPTTIDDVGEPVVEYRGRRYTFAFATFRKSSRPLRYAG